MCIHAVEAPDCGAAACNAAVGRRAAGEEHARGEAHVCVRVRMLVLLPRLWERRLCVLAAGKGGGAAGCGAAAGAVAAGEACVA